MLTGKGRSDIGCGQISESSVTLKSRIHQLTIMALRFIRSVRTLGDSITHVFFPYEVAAGTTKHLI